MRFSGITKVTIVTAIVIILVAAVAIYYIMSPPAPAPVTKKAWRVGTTEVGSVGYVLGALLADVMKKTIPEAEISTYPVGGWPVNTKEFAIGNLEFAYTDPPTCLLAMQRKSPFEGLPPGALIPVHTIYVCPFAYVIATTPEIKEKYGLKSWRDLDGKKVALFPSGWINHKRIMDALATIGVKPTHIDMDLTLYTDALKKEDVVAVGIHHGGGVPSSHTIEITTKLKIVLLNPLPEDAEKIKKAGLPFDWVSPEPFGKDLGVDKVFACLAIGGWNTHPKLVSEEDVYRIIKGLIAMKDELKALSPYFGEFAKDPIGLQVRAISLAPDLPVHPGLAKVLKEYGVWKEEWKIAS